MTAQLVDPVQDGDPVLLSRVRAGDADAYGLLFERHRAAATAFAGGLAGHGRADDLVAEAFAKVLDALQRDLGPTVSFRSYLLTSIRSIWNNTVRRERRYDLIDDYETLPPSDALMFTDDPEQRFDNQAVAEAYRSLPERWQAVLWYTAVEGLPHGEVAVHLGINANAVAALSFRAREGLRQAYLSAHLRTTADATCQAWAPLLPAYARGSVDKRKQAGLRSHLDGCVSCTLALADLDEVNNRLGALLLPILLGSGAIGMEGLWAGITGAATTGATTAATTGATTGAATTGKAGGVLLAGKSSLAVTLAAGIVGAAVAVPVLVDALSSYDGRPGAADVHSRAVDSTDAFLGPRATGAPTSDAPQPTSPASDEGTAPGVGPDASAPGSPVDEVGRAEATQRDPDVQVETPAEPSDPPTEGPGTPTPPVSGLSPDVGFGEPSVGQISLLGQALTSVTFPLVNVRTGTTVSVVVTNLVGFPLTWGNAGWHCPGAIGGLPGDVIRTETTITCTRTGDDQATGELKLALLTSGTSDVTATVAQVPGVVDPVPGNDSVAVSISW